MKAYSRDVRDRILQPPDVVHVAVHRQQATNLLRRGHGAAERSTADVPDGHAGVPETEVEESVAHEGVMRVREADLRRVDLLRCGRIAEIHDHELATHAAAGIDGEKRVQLSIHASDFRGVDAEDGVVAQEARQLHRLARIGEAVDHDRAGAYSVALTSSAPSSLTATSPRGLRVVHAHGVDEPSARLAATSQM
jgi:hypothetical protein